jgi:hypothetical protein
LERRRARLAPRSTAPALNTDEIGIDAAESRLLRDLKDANRTAEHDDELHRLTERYEKNKERLAKRTLKDRTYSAGAQKTLQEQENTPVDGAPRPRGGATARAGTIRRFPHAS